MMSLRWIFQHMSDEYARLAGAAREIDVPYGAINDGLQIGSIPSAPNEQALTHFVDHPAGR